tara:strand:- start:740 stop:1075 length:336 start_codon:yes stop_codon:yes gene_type:complete
MSDTIKINVDNWNVRLEERNRGRMKIIIKLGKDEAEAFKNFETTVKPEEVDSATFAKSIFFNGIEHMNRELSALVQKYIEENPDASGMLGMEGGDFDSSGGLEIISEPESV